jgi:hypothetical protein
MKNNSSLTVQELYPDRIYIPLDPESRELAIVPGNFEPICQSKVRAYLQKNLGLNIDLAYPTDIQLMPLVSQLVDGFVLTVEGIRIVFIPSEDLDFSGFEIEQEWVDLSNWVADYYVPVQVDLESKLLHLWGFISHRNVKDLGEFDRIFRTYSLDGQYLSDNLDNLWLTCELLASGEMLPDRAAISPLPQLLPQTAREIIGILRQHQSVFSPRLDLDFERWGGILNQPPYLDLYLNLTPAPEPIATVTSIRSTITKLSDWLDGQSVAIYQDWKSIGEFFQSPQLQAGFRSIDSVKELTICPQSNLMYRNISGNIESLAEIIKNTNSQHERWEAIEYLWKLDPEHPALPIYKLLDLSLFFQGEQLSLLVSIVPTKTGKLGILIRLSPNREQTQLPLGIKLSRLDEEGNISRETIAQDRNYQCLQLIFDADFGRVFSICVTLNDNQLIKHFQV